MLKSKIIALKWMFPLASVVIYLEDPAGEPIYFKGNGQEFEGLTKSEFKALDLTKHEVYQKICLEWIKIN